MLRVRTIYASGAPQAARYYAGYAGYLDPEVSHESPGEWEGRQAALMGLSGGVSQCQLEDLLSGLDPTTGATMGSPFRDKLTESGRLIRAVAGYDATFSAPKTVSLWWGLTGDPGVLEAHNLAVRAALTHLEAYGCTTRVWHNGRRMFPEADGLTVALFQQSTSREDDPQLHTHAVISAKVVAPDGRWLALDARYLKKHQQVLGRIYQSVLRAELTHRYGVAWGPIDKGQAEIDGVPKDLVEVFSKRASQVEALREDLTMAFLEREGRDPTRRESAVIEREAAVDSRRPKTGLSVADAQTRWTEEAQTLGWDGDRLSESILGRHQPEANRLTVEEVIDTVTAQSSTWRRADLVGAICDHAPPSGGWSGADWARALEHAADRLQDQQVDLDPSTAGAIRIGDGRSVWMDPMARHLTHDQVLAQEERILSWVLDTHDQPAAPSGTVDTDRLDPLQAGAASAVAGADPIVLVVGPAGTGKTTTLTAATDDLHRQRRPVFGLAPTAKAARVLESETGIGSDTIAKMLYEWDRDHGPSPIHLLPAGTTVVVDEAGMVGTDSLDRLIGLARTQSWRLVLVGDPRQLQAVGRGGMFQELCRAGRSHHLQHIHRFTHPWEAQASLGLRAGRPEAIDAYLDHRRVHPDHFQGHLDRIADAWIRHDAQGMTVAITAETNTVIDALNRAVQDTRRDLGHLDEATARPIAAGETASPGDLVVTRRNDRTIRTDHDEPVRNRELWRVDAISPDGTVTLARRNGQCTVVIPADYARQHLRLGYAATAHGHQGDTVDISYTLVTPGTSHQALYVGATRGRIENHLAVVCDESDLDHARDILEYALTTNLADTPAIAVRRDLQTPVREHQPEQVDPLDAAEGAVIRAASAARPHQKEVDAARHGLHVAQASLTDLQRRYAATGPVGKLRLRDGLTEARLSLEAAQQHLDLAIETARPALNALATAIETRDALHQRRRLEHALDRPAPLAQEPARPAGPELELGL